MLLEVIDKRSFDPLNEFGVELIKLFQKQVLQLINNILNLEFYH
jgi:hypothetical protein